MNISGKIALVTGGSRGIGWAIAIPLAEAGADVAVNYKENKSTADDLGSSIIRPEEVAVMRARNGYLTG